MLRKPVTGATRFPPAIDLDDAGVRWSREPDGTLVLTRTVTLRGLLFPGIVLAVIAFLLRESVLRGAWALTGLFTLALVLWLPFTLVRASTRFEVRVGRDGVQWTQARPFRRHGAWSSADVRAVRVREDARGARELRPTRRVDVDVRGHGRVAFASGKSARRALALAEALAGAAGVRCVDARAAARQNDAA